MQMYKKVDNYGTEKRVLKIIFEDPTKRFYIRELARLTNLNPNTIINIINRLVKEEIIIKEKKKHVTELLANIENKDFIIKKRIFNLEQLYISGLINFLEKEYNPISISVIGSYAKGEDIKKSDIDIVIISDKKAIIDLTDYEKKLARKIHLITTNYKEMSEEFYTNFINGIVLYGYINKK